MSSTTHLHHVAQIVTADTALWIFIVDAARCLDRSRASRRLAIKVGFPQHVAQHTLARQARLIRRHDCRSVANALTQGFAVTMNFEPKMNPSISGFKKTSVMSNLQQSFSGNGRQPTTALVAKVSDPQQTTHHNAHRLHG